MKAEVVLEILGDLTNKPLEWQLLEEQVGGPLVLTNVAQRYRAGAVAMGFLDSTRSGPASGLGGELFAGGLATGWLAGGLFGARHESSGCRWGVSYGRGKVFVFVSTCRALVRVLCTCELTLLQAKTTSSKKLVCAIGEITVILSVTFGPWRAP